MHLPPYPSPIISIAPYRLNKIIPNLYKNLQDSVISFIDAIQSGEQIYLKQIVSPQLYNEIQKDIQYMKKFDIKISHIKHDKKKNFNKHLAIYPYVIFGDRMQNRREFHYKYFQIGRNKFLNFQTALSLKNNIQHIVDHHIYGFNCYYNTNGRYIINHSNQTLNTNKISGSEQNDNNTVNSKKSNPKTDQEHQIMITFETNSQPFDFIIMDAQGYLKNRSMQKQGQGQK